MPRLGRSCAIWISATVVAAYLCGIAVYSRAQGPANPDNSPAVPTRQPLRAPTSHTAEAPQPTNSLPPPAHRAPSAIPPPARFRPGPDLNQPRVLGSSVPMPTPRSRSILNAKFSPIDLNTALRLAGVQNPELLVARQRVLESVALRDSSRLRRFSPRSTAVPATTRIPAHCNSLTATSSP
jgi:hypothetical protein